MERPKAWLARALAATAVAALGQLGCMQQYEPVAAEEPPSPTDTPSPDGCATDDAMANDGCNWTCNDPRSPELRISQVDFETPAVLGNPVIAGVFRQTIDDLELVWLLRATEDGSFRTGPGQCQPDDPWNCSFDEQGVAERRLGRDSQPGHVLFPRPEDDSFQLSLQMRSSVWGDFPLIFDEARMEATLMAAGNCIGRREDIWTWESGGTLTGKLRMSTARNIDIDLADMTLCDLVGGALSGQRLCTDIAEPETFPSPPDTDVDGEPAWTVRLSFAAIGTHIAP